MEAAKEAGAHELIMNLKDGYDIYIVGWGMKLSGGQKQWLSIACVLRWFKYKFMYHEKEKAATGLEPVTAKPFLPNPYLDYFDKLEFLDEYNMWKINLTPS